MAQTVADNLRELTFSILDVKEKFATNLADKGVSSITTANTLNQMADSISGITTGGGGGNPNAQWEEIGYTSQPQYITDAIAHAKEIKDNWNVKTTSANFRGDNSLVFFPFIDFSKVTTMSYTFLACSSLIIFPQLNTSKVTNFYGCFSNCSSLKEIPKLDVSCCTDMGRMFYSCDHLTEIPQLDVSSCLNMNQMFGYCKSLTTLPELNTSKVTNFQEFLYYCDSLTKITQLDVSSATNMTNMITSCNKLRFLKLIGLGTQPTLTSIELGNSYSNKLIGIDGDGVTGCRQALIDTLITNSFDRATAGYSPCKITLHQNTKNLLTEDELAQITAKGFTIA